MKPLATSHPHSPLTPGHAALVRDDNNNIQVRRFPTATDAARASATLEAPLVTVEAVKMSDKTAMVEKIPHAEFAKKLGVPPTLIRKAALRGALPGAVQHSSHWIMIPKWLLRVVHVNGLVVVERMARAGMLKEGGV